MKTRLLGVFAAMGAVASPVFAQVALEEIVVTAQRREQSLQEVPISVTAFTGDTLKQANITEAAQYLALTPNVSWTEDGQVGSRGISISMRGVSNINTDESSFIQSIGVYLDEFSVASVGQGTINPQLQDLERIEVLRGPQGTYFGRNAVGGALNITTKKPVNEVEGYVTAGARSFEDAGEQWDIEGMLNVPVTDNFFLRGVAYYEDSSGLVENIVPGGDDSGHEYLMLRGAARWLIGDRTTADLLLMYTDEDQGMDENVPSGVWDTDSVATFFLPQPPGIATPVNPGNVGFYPSNQSEHARTALGEKNENEATTIILNVAHELNDQLTLRGIAGFIDTETDRLFDNDLVPENVVFREQQREGESWSIELRGEYSSDPFDLIAGFLFSHDEKDITNGVQLGTTTLVNGVDFADVGALPPTFLNDVFGRPFCLACSVDGFEMDSWAVFADFTWHATDRLDVSVGGRYTEDDVENSFLGFGPTGDPRFPNPAFPDSDTIVASETFDDFSPRVAATFSVNENVNVYGVVSKGYKAGGFSQGVNTAPDPVEPINQRFDEEELWNFEVGVKSELLDDRLRLNVSAFYLEWSDLQLETFFFLVPGDPTSNVELTINVEDAEALGFEAEALAILSDRWTLSAGLGYVDTEITSSDQARLSGNLVVNLNGEPLPRAPEWTGNVAAEYRMPMATNDELWVRAEYIYRDEQFSTIEDVTYLQTSNQPILDNSGTQIAQVPDRSDGFPFRGEEASIFNLRAGYILNETWEFVAYVENAFDEEYFTGTGENFGLSGFRLRPHPRTIGGNVTWRFR